MAATDMKSDVNATVERKSAPRRRRRKKRLARLGMRLLRAPGTQAAFSGFVANYLRLVNATSRLTFDPSDPYVMHASLAPVIFTMWHGQHFMLPFVRQYDLDVRVLISRHHDGEINARVAHKLGIDTIRGSGARDPSRMLEKGGLLGFMEMRTALDEGAFVCMTADISNLAPRRAGLGIVSLARASGRPIVPIAYASSRRIDITSWDRATVNLPFSRAVCAVGEIVEVPSDADDVLLEAKRREVEDALNEATERAYALVDRRHV
jgi:lysophospholipid acyltransferase (LPLAT)-like uncharacterized protein